VADLKDFLNSKSMLTPGIAGAITMLVTNTLHIQFDLPHKWVALVLSFLLGTLVFGDKTTPPWQRGIFYLFNSLIIFAMAAGTNAAGEGLAPDTQGNFAEAARESFFQNWL
jgi:hypothetical protein